MGSVKKLFSAANGRRVPTLSEAYPEYAMLYAKRTELVTEKGKLEAESVQISERVQFGKAAKASDVRIAMLLGDDVPSASIDGDRARLVEIQTRIGDITRALESLDHRISRARYAASAIICDRLKPEYCDRVAKICAALIAVHEAHRDYVDLVREIEDMNVAWSPLYPMPLNSVIGNFWDNQKPLGNYLREAAQQKFIETSAIPEDLRSAGVSASRRTA